MTNVQGMCTLVHAKVMRLIDGTFMRVPQEPGKPGISPTARSKTKEKKGERRKATCLSGRIQGRSHHCHLLALLKKISQTTQITESEPACCTCDGYLQRIWAISMLLDN